MFRISSLISQTVGCMIFFSKYLDNNDFKLVASTSSCVPAHSKFRFVWNISAMTLTTENKQSMNVDTNSYFSCHVVWRETWHMHPWVFCAFACVLSLIPSPAITFPLNNSWNIFIRPRLAVVWTWNGLMFPPSIHFHNLNVGSSSICFAAFLWLCFLLSP